MRKADNGDKDLPANPSDVSSIPGLGRSHGRRHGHPLQYSCLENPMDRGDWWAIVHAAAAATVKSLQWCLSLCDPRDGSPPASPIPGIPCVKQTTNKNRWYSTGNSTQCSVVT